MAKETQRWQKRVRCNR